MRGGGFLVSCVGPAGGHVDLLKRRSTRVDSLVVGVDDVLAFLQVGLRGRVLHVADGLFLRQHAGQREEGRLQDGVRALAHANLLGQIDGVDQVQLDVVGSDVALGLGVQMMLELLERPLAVDQEGATGLDVLHHAEALRDVGRIVACHEIGLVHVVRAANGAVAEAQMRHRNAAGLLRVVLEVGLYVLVGVVADDLDGVLVRADRAVAAETPELALDGAFGRRVRAVRIFGKREVGNVVDDADRELALGSVLLELFEDGKRTGRRRVLGAEAIAAAHDGVEAGHAAFLHESVHHVEEQRLATGTRLLRAVHDGDLLAGGRQRGHELLGNERAVQTHLHEADLLAVRVQVVDYLLDDVAETAHGDDDAVGVGRAIVVEQLVVGADLGVDGMHAFLDDRRQRIVVRIASLAMLEEDVAVLVTTAHRRMLGVERMLAERLHGVHVAELRKVVVVPHGDLLDLVRGAEAVEEVEERHAALDGGKVRHGRQVHDLLHVALGEHSEASLAAGHDIGMVAEDVERMRGQRAGRHVEDGGQLLCSNLVHVGDHEQQALACRVRAGKRASAERAVHRARGAALGLHLDHFHRGAEDVLLALRRPLVDVVGHRGRRGDRVNSRHFGKCIRHIRRRIVAVH